MTTQLIEDLRWSDPVPTAVFTLLGFELKSFGQYGNKWVQELAAPMKPVSIAEGATWYELCHAIGGWQYDAYSSGYDLGRQHERDAIGVLFSRLA
jgi:hypothetical protein